MRKAILMLRTTGNISPITEMVGKRLGDTHVLRQHSQSAARQHRLAPRNSAESSCLNRFILVWSFFLAEVEEALLLLLCQTIVSVAFHLVQDMINLLLVFLLLLAVVHVLGIFAAIPLRGVA